MCILYLGDDKPIAQVSVIQPVSGCGLAILSIFSHFYLQEVMNVIDWMGITLAGIGTIGNASFSWFSYLITPYGINHIGTITKRVQSEF